MGGSESVFIFKNGQAVDIHNLIGVDELPESLSSIVVETRYNLTHILSSIQIKVQRRIDSPSYTLDDMKAERLDLISAWSAYKLKVVR